MIARIDFTWEARQKICKDEHLWAAVNEIVPIGEWKEGQTYFHTSEIIVDITIIGQQLADLGVNFEIKAMAQNAFVKDVNTQIQDLSRRLKLTEVRLCNSGDIVQVHVPNLGLLAINEVEWMEDACTEALQGELDRGWRILAVCPPLMERRPTYIIGRYNPDKEKDQDKPVFKTIILPSLA